MVTWHKLDPILNSEKVAYISLGKRIKCLDNGNIRVTSFLLNYSRQFKKAVDRLKLSQIRSFLSFYFQNKP